MIRRLWKIAIAMFAMLGVVTAVVMFTPVTSWWARTLAGPVNDPTGDILIVLGSDSPTRQYIGYRTYWRSVYAGLAWEQRRFSKIILSGGSGVANSMKDFLVFEGVPASALILEAKSVSTHENALYTAEMLRHVPGRKVLMTSDFHMYRALRAFRAAGLQVEPRPIPDALKRYSTWSNRWWVFIDLCLETAKIAGYRFKGWI